MLSFDCVSGCCCRLQNANSFCLNIIHLNDCMNNSNDRHAIIKSTNARNFIHILILLIAKKRISNKLY